MSDHDEDPYAVSSDEDEEGKGPPPKIAIERSNDLQQVKDSLNTENRAVKDEVTLKEIEEIRAAKAEELKAMKAGFETGAIKTAEGVQKTADTVTGLDRQTLSSFKDKFENLDATLDQNVKERLQAGENVSEELASIQSGRVKSNLDKFKAGPENNVAIDEEKLKELESLSQQVGDIKNKWKTGDVERSEQQEDLATKDELEELKKAGVKVKERFQPPSEGDVVKSYDASELQGSSAANARKSFIEGSAFNGAGGVEKTSIEQIDVQLRNLKQAFEKPESQMTPEERAEKKRDEIEKEFLRYKMARKMRQKKQQEDGGSDELEGEAVNEDAFDVKTLMDKFKNIENLAPKQIASKLDELEQLRVEAAAMRERFENAADTNGLSEEKKRQLEEEFIALREERERAKRELEQELAEASKGQLEKEEIQIAADHAQKMTAKWEKIHAKEAKKAEKSKMTQKVADK